MEPERFDPLEGVEPYGGPAPGDLSVARAVLSGHAVVSGGVAAIVAATMLVGSLVTNLPLVLLAGLGCLLGWPYWSVMVPRWWRWALARGIDPYDLQEAAEAAQLVWPRDSLLARTELGDRWAGIDTPTEDPLLRIRDQLLSGGDATAFGVSVDEPIWGVVGELGLGDDVATLIAFDDGTCAVHSHAGSGVIRAGEHPAIRDATRALVELGERVGAELPVANDFTVPGPGEVAFYLLLSDRVRGIRGPRARVLSSTIGAELYSATQALLTAVRGRGGDPRPPALGGG